MAEVKVIDTCSECCPEHMQCGVRIHTSDCKIAVARSKRLLLEEKEMRHWEGPPVCSYKVLERNPLNNIPHYRRDQCPSRNQEDQVTAMIAASMDGPIGFYALHHKGAPPFYQAILVGMPHKFKPCPDCFHLHRQGRAYCL